MSSQVLEFYKTIGSHRRVTHFPFLSIIRAEKEIKRFLGRNHIESKHWLVLSYVHKGHYCKYCVLFSSEFGGHQKGSHLQSLVTKPVTTFAKLLGEDGSLESHERNEYHKKSVEADKNFIKTYLHPENAVLNQVVTHRIEKIAENQQRLRPIVETIIFFR